MRILLTLITLCWGVCAFSQVEISSNEQRGTNLLGKEVITRRPLSFRITPPLSEWKEKQTPSEVISSNEVQHPKIFNKKPFTQITSEDKATQFTSGTKEIRSPEINFDGQDGSSYPPDPSGAVGPNHYVQAVNSSFQVYDKTGVALTAELDLSSLWPGIVDTIGGDPIVMYDRHADRWFIAQMTFYPNQISVAVSQTPDPTGSYAAYVYSFTSFPDYPKFAVWWDGYYMSTNSPTESAAVFERTEMLLGNPGAQLTILDGAGNAIISDADGPLPPNGTPCYFFQALDDQSMGNDRLFIYEMTTDWVTPSNTQFALSQELPVTSFSANYPIETIPQPSTSQMLDGLQGFMHLRAQHLRWVGYNTIVLSHTVDVGTGAGVRWYELRDNDDGIWTIHQHSTYAPWGMRSRWLGAAAMDDFGNIGLAYSLCDPILPVYPSIAYTGRLATDPLDEMTFIEQYAIEGEASQTTTSRFGDYSHMSLDPDGSTFWYTGEYIDAAGDHKTRIFSFNLQLEASLESAYIHDTDLQIAYHDSKITVTLNKQLDNGLVQIDLIAMNGKILSSTSYSGSEPTITHDFETSSFESGIYFVRIGNSNFQKAKKVFIGQ